MPQWVSENLSLMMIYVGSRKLIPAPVRLCAEAKLCQSHIHLLVM